MNGIFNVLKPPGMTSFDVVAYLRGKLKIRKIGHTGTLDPGAVGVLPVCVGKATKAIEYLIDRDKAYRAEMVLGISTDTQDSMGKVLKRSDKIPAPQKIAEAIKEFVGDYSQIPPMYSAIKVGGKKLYELARNDIEIKRDPRDVKIHFIDILNVDGEKVIFDVGCSKGTYIRTLCADIGERLGCGGHMSFLVRMQSGEFDIKNSLTIEQISRGIEENIISNYMVGIDRVFEEYKGISLDEDNTKKFLNGGFVPVNDPRFILSQRIRVYSYNGEFLALGNIIQNKKNGFHLKSVKLFI